MPVTSEAIVGNRRAGATAVADQVTAPSFTRDDNTGIAPQVQPSAEVRDWVEFAQKYLRQ